jgi:ribosomal protein S18 acetylase RimI-like enzyme
MVNTFLYKKQLKNGYVIKNSSPENAEGLAALQKIVFPKLSDDEIFTKEHYLKHMEIFPEGQFVILDGDRVIGMPTTVRSELLDKPHTFLEASGNLTLENYDPEGDWLSGLDVGVDPEYRGKGLGREIYRARQELVNYLGLKGQFTVGMINGYHKVSNLMTTEEYFEKLVNKEINDPTVSVQERIGFKINKLIRNYCEDETCGNCGILLTMNADHKI